MDHAQKIIPSHSIVKLKIHMTPFQSIKDVHQRIMVYHIMYTKITCYITQLTILGAQDTENVKTFIIPIENKQGPMPSPLNNTYTSNVVYRNVLL